MDYEQILTVFSFSYSKVGFEWAFGQAMPANLIASGRKAVAAAGINRTWFQRTGLVLAAYDRK